VVVNKILFCFPFLDSKRPSDRGQSNHVWTHSHIYTYTHVYIYESVTLCVTVCITVCLTVCLTVYLIRLKRRYLKERESGVSLHQVLKTTDWHSKERKSGAALDWATRMRVVSVFGAGRAVRSIKRAKRRLDVWYTYVYVCKYTCVIYICVNM